MMAKIVKGGSFGGCVRYVTGKRDAKLLAAEGVLLDSRPSVIDSFEAQSQLNPRLGRKVGHISLNFSAQDAGRISDAFMLKVAGEYMQKMGIVDTQFIVVRHNDREHPHCHIVFNRVDNNGATISDKNDRLRSVKACRAITERHGLYIAGGKENVNRQQLRDPDSVKYAIYDAVKAALPECRNWGDLEKRLAKSSIAVTFKYSGGTGVKQGIIFGKDGLSFNGSKIDRQFSFSKLDAVLNGNAQRLDSQTNPTREIRNILEPTPERVTTPTIAPSPQQNHRYRVEPSHGHSQAHSHSGGSFLDGVFDMELGPGLGEKDDSGQKPKKRKKKQYKPSC